jgi:thiol-disulfide isomerase/thioredoxin
MMQCVRRLALLIFLIRTVALVYFVSAALITGTKAHAQGYEVLPWPAHKAVPALAGTDLRGKAWRLSDLRGKAVLINFWASWCEPCRAEMPSLDTVAQFYGPEKLVVLAVNFKESPSVVLRHVQVANFGLPVLLDPDGAIAHDWGANVFPTTALVAADGRVLGVLRGEFDWTSVQAGNLLTSLMPVAAQHVKRRE